MIVDATVFVSNIEIRNAINIIEWIERSEVVVKFSRLDLVDKKLISSICEIIN